MSDLELVPVVNALSTANLALPSAPMLEVTAVFPVVLPAKTLPLAAVAVI